MSIPGLLLKNQLRGYRKLFSKGWPLAAVLLVFVLFVAGAARALVANPELVGACLPPIYTGVLLLFAGRRLLFLKYPPFFFSWPGLYFFLTTPVNHRLVLAGKILLSYIPLFFLSLGWSLLAGQARTGLPGGAAFFFCLASMANISWLLYNAAAGRIFLRKGLTFLGITVLLLLKTPAFVWALIAAGSFWRALASLDKIDWSKYERHCRLAYLSRKYLLAGDWGGLETLTYEYAREEPPAASFLATRVYVTGYKAFLYAQILLMSRYPFPAWVVFLGQYAFSVFLMGKGEFLPFFGGSLLLSFGFAGLFFLPVRKLGQKMAQGLFPAGGFPAFLTGMFILPAAVAWVFLAAVFSLVPAGFNPVWAMAASFFPAAGLSYLTVVRGMFQPGFYGWFVTGALLCALLFSCIHRALWGETLGVLLLFIPYVILSGRRMKKIYERV